MKKKNSILLASVVGIVALGLILSLLVDWPVDMGQSEGNIGKSSRFSRKTADVAALSNMQELLLNDKSYKNSVVMGYIVMQTRAKQFDALVDMSNEVAGDIQDFDGILKEMNEARPIIDNVCASLEAAGKEMNSAFGGKNSPDLAQNTINASLAYTTLQKQNKLADLFITTTDKYLKDNEGSDGLKFVRDQWLDYQQMTAAINQDAKATAELQKKGYALTPEQTASAMNTSCSVSEMKACLDGAAVSNVFGLETGISHLPADQLMTMVELRSFDGPLDDELKVGDAIQEVLGNEENAARASQEVRDNYHSIQKSVNDAVSTLPLDNLSSDAKDAVNKLPLAADGDNPVDFTSETLSRISFKKLGCVIDFPEINDVVNTMVGQMEVVKIFNTINVDNIPNESLNWWFYNLPRLNNIANETINNMATGEVMSYSSFHR